MMNGWAGPDTQDPHFGEADLSNCEREPIHLADSIQPHGVLLVVREPDLTIIQASANASTFLNLAGAVLGKPLASLGGNLAERVQSRLGEPLDAIPVAVRCQIATLSLDLDGSIHRPARGGVIVELEIAGPPQDLGPLVQEALETIAMASTLAALAAKTAIIFRHLAGYDRVMVYQFDEEGHGSVIAEERQPEHEPYLGNRYPASDIPQIARRLYERNRIRVLGDVDYQPVPLISAPHLQPDAPLDMSLSGLRSMSPIHIQYLKNMGVRATLATSLMVKGRLWGLVICHHDSPRLVPYPVRVVCALLAEAIATRITALEGFAQVQAEIAVRRLEERMVSALATTNDWERRLFDRPQELLEPLGASGVVLLRDDVVLKAGGVPSLPQLRDLQDWLGDQSQTPLYATCALASQDSCFDPITPIAAGVLAVPISSCQGEYLIWFRPERIRTLTWAGNPYEAVKSGTSAGQLSPRDSFAHWHEVVKGRSEPWTQHDFSLALQIGDSVRDLMQQVRSIRLLITQQQVKRLCADLHSTEQPLVIADPTKKIIFINKAFASLLPLERRWDRLDDLLRLFEGPTQAKIDFIQVITQHYPWSGEVRLTTPGGIDRSFLLRVDPVASPAAGLLGYVVICNDLSEHKAAELARRQFDENLGSHGKIANISIGCQSGGLFHDLLASIMGNAQLAAIENHTILEVNQVPMILDHLYASLARTTELLEHLMWYEGRSSEHGIKTN